MCVCVCVCVCVCEGYRRGNIKGEREEEGEREDLRREGEETSGERERRYKGRRGLKRGQGLPMGGGAEDRYMSSLWGTGPQ